MRKTILSIAILIFLIGIAHIAVTPLTYKAFTVEAMWFAGLGLALIFLSFIHFMLLMGDQRTLFYIFGYIGNGLSVIFFGLFLSIVNSPNIITLFILLLIQTIMFILFQQRSTK